MLSSDDDIRLLLKALRIFCFILKLGTKYLMKTNINEGLIVMAVEYLIRLADVTKHPDSGTHRLRGSIVSVKLYPNSGWGKMEALPSYGVLRVTDQAYKDVENANTRWFRDWIWQENTLSVTNILTITETTPTLRTSRITSGELQSCFDPKLHDEAGAFAQLGSVVLEFKPKTDDAMDKLKRRVR